MRTIFQKELLLLMTTTTGIVPLLLFLLSNGLLLWIIPGAYNVFDSGYAHLDGFFEISPWLFLFLIPAIAMRFFAEEKITGNWEILQTKPIDEWQIVIGKFLSGVTIIIIALLLSLVNYISILYLADPMGNIDNGQFWGGFIGLLLLSTTYMSISTFIASLTDSQTVVFVISILLCFLFYYGFELFSYLLPNNSTMFFVENIGLHTHYQSISRGVVDSRDISYFLIITNLFIILTVLKLKRKK